MSSQLINELIVAVCHYELKRQYVTKSQSHCNEFFRTNNSDLDDVLDDIGVKSRMMELGSEWKCVGLP